VEGVQQGRWLVGGVEERFEGERGDDGWWDPRRGWRRKVGIERRRGPVEQGVQQGRGLVGERKFGTERRRGPVEGVQQERWLVGGVEGRFERESGDDGWWEGSKEGSKEKAGTMAGGGTGNDGL
jgi:hypothetical protein